MKEKCGDKFTSGSVTNQKSAYLKKALYTNIQFVYFEQTILEDDDYKDLMSSDDSDESDEEAKGR